MANARAELWAYPLPVPVRSVPAPGVEVRPVPPLAVARVPAIVSVPVDVTGPPEKDRPVVPPEASTLDTPPPEPPVSSPPVKSSPLNVPLWPVRVVVEPDTLARMA